MCGTPFKAKRADAKCCTKTCRVALQRMLKSGAQEEETTPKEDDEIIIKIENVKTKSPIAGILNVRTSKKGETPKEEESDEKEKD